MSTVALRLIIGGVCLVAGIGMLLLDLEADKRRLKAMTDWRTMTRGDLDRMEVELKAIRWRMPLAYAFLGVGVAFAIWSTL